MFEDEIKEYESIRNKILVFSEFTMQNISVFSEEMQKIILVFSYFYSKTLVIIRNNAYICAHNPFDEALLKEVNRLVTEHTIAYRAQGGELSSGMFLVSFFFQTAIKRMKEELAQKRKNSIPTMFF